MTRRKIIIDTDPGHDDAIAILLACNIPELEIVAVTTVCGNSTIENTTRNARFVLGMAPNASLIPVYSGAGKPLTRSLVQASVHGTSGLEGIDPTNASELTGDAVDRIVELVNASPDEITIVALAPLTNIAQAITRQPEVMKRVKEIIIMGGAIDVPGNMHDVAEFNTFVDPEATQIVLQSGVRITLVPLDACNNVSVEISQLNKLKDSNLRELFIQMLSPYAKNLAQEFGTTGALMYDPLTVFYLLNPSACTVIERQVTVDTSDGSQRGKTTAQPATGLNDVQIAIQIPESDFTDWFFETLNN